MITGNLAVQQNYLTETEVFYTADKLVIGQFKCVLTSKEIKRVQQLVD